MLSWPLARDFSSLLLSDGGDARHNLWTLWHVHAWAEGRDPLFSTDLLFFPRGASLLTHAPGPLLGFLALPLWPLGPVVVYNGILLLAFAFTGFCGYVLARGLGNGFSIALFAGIALMAAPFTLAGLYGHPTKVFAGGLALALLAWKHGCNPGKPRGWIIAPGLALLLLMLHDGYQVVFAALAGAAIAMDAMRPAVTRAAVARRLVLVAFGVAVCTGPLLVATMRAAADPALRVDLRVEAAQNRADAVLLLLPPFTSRLSGWLSIAASQRFGFLLNIETAVAVPWTITVLALLGLRHNRAAAAPWLLIAASCALLALGPSLQLLNQRALLPGGGELPLPYTLLSSLPGLSFLRAPGRFMILGTLCLIVAACIGLRSLSGGRRGLWAPVVAAALLLLETWPAPFPQERLPEVPHYYQQLATDQSPMAVLDMPVAPFAIDQGSYLSLAPTYQFFQIVHGKPIASGFLARTYTRHPIIPELTRGIAEATPMAPLRVNGRPVGYADTEGWLATNGYQRLVWHRTILPGATQAATAQLVAAILGPRTPDYTDTQVWVYRLQPSSVTIARFGDGWYDAEPAQRWASSRAEILVVSPQKQKVQLVLTPSAIYEPGRGGGGAGGELEIAVGDEAAERVPITVGVAARITLRLPPGPASITLRLVAGSFRPGQSGTDDGRVLSFAVRDVDLVTP